MIVSKTNKIVKETLYLHTKKGRNKENMFIIEGADFVSSIPPDVKVKYFLISETFYNNNDISCYKNRGTIHILKDNIFDICSDTVNSKGIICICEKLNHSLEKILKEKNNFLVIVNGVQDPGNLGTIIRTAESAGAKGIVITKGSCDLYNLKTIRSTAGAIFNIPIFDNISEDFLINKLKGNDIDIISTYLHTEKYYYDENFTKSIALVVGNEGNGISKEFIENSNKLVKIPMIGKSESLNVSVSCSIVLYEVVRQRHIKL